MAGINPFSTIQEMPRWEGVPQSFVEWIVRMILRMNTTKTSDQANYQSRSRFRACDVPWNNDFEIFPDTEVVADGWERDFETTGTVSDANYGRSKTPWKGTYAQQIKTTGSNGVSLACRPIPVKDETKYTLTAQAKIDNASSAQDGFYARVVWYNTDADFSRAGAASFIDVVAGTENFFTANDTYTAVSGEVSVPAGAKFARIAFYSWTQAGAARMITVDGVTFVQTTIPLSASDGNLDDIDDGSLGFKIHWNEKLYLKQLSSWSHNLLINFSFEYTGIDEFLYGWNHINPGAGKAFNIRNDYTKAKTGNNYGELSGNAEVYCGLYAAMPYGYLGRSFEVNVGETFAVSAWVYIETAGANTVINLNVSEQDRSGTWLRNNNVSTTTSGSWVQLTNTITVPAGTKYLQLYFSAYNAAASYVVRVDDVIFKAAATPNPFLISSDYTFSVAPGGTLTASTPATVTLSPYPSGMAVNSQVYISGGTGTAESVQITAITSSTITFTPANNHSGAWTVSSATAGIQEAYSSASSGVHIFLPQGEIDIYGPIYLSGKSLILQGHGQTSFGATVRGTRIHNNGSGLMFSVPQSNSQVIDSEFKLLDLTVDGGEGVLNLYNISTNNNFTCENCAFINMSGIVFEIGENDTDGDAYLVKITRCFFYEVGIAVLQHKFGEITFRDSYIWRYNTRGIELRGNDAKVVNSYFLTDITTGEDILIYPYSDTALATGYILIDGCKFGNEEVTAGEVRAKIRVGTPALKASNPTYYVMGLKIVNNDFLGTIEDGASKTACIYLHSPIHSSIIANNFFCNSTYAIDDSGMDQSVYSCQNIYIGNRHFLQTLPFKSGGKGFNAVNDIDQAPASISFPATNLVSYSENFGHANWVKYNVTKTGGQADPNGGTSAYSFNRTGPAGFVAIATASVGAGTYVFSVWLKSGTLDKVSIEIATSGGTTIARTTVALTTYWRRYYVRAADLATSTTYNLYIKVSPNEGSATGTIYAFGAQLSNTEGPIAYLVKP